jgi:HupE / UreJ protein
VRRLVAALALVVAFCGSALSHVTSTGLAIVDVDDGKLTYRLTLVAVELAPEVGRTLLAAAEGSTAAAEQMAQAMRAHARFSVDGEACAPGRITIRGSTVGDTKVVLEMVLSCRKATGALAIQDDWQKILGEHFQTVMSLRRPGQPSAEFAFGEGRREATVELNKDAGTGWLAFIAMGMEHILGGLDHLLFLLALLAPARSFWRTVQIVTGFTVAHSLTLSLAALGAVDVPSHIVEPAIAASIVWVAVENLVAPAGIGRRWLVAAIFGLVHGLGFAGGLTELGLDHAAMLRALVGFNVGVELGQVVFVALVMPLFVWASQPGRFTWLPQALSVVVAVFGMGWLVERLFFA